MWPIVLVGLAILLISSATLAETGGMSGAYLRSPVGAAHLGRGGSGIANPDYLRSWWNPASLTTLRKKELTLGSGIRAFGRTESYAAWESRVPPRVGIGLMLLYRGDPFLGDIYDADQNVIGSGSYSTFTGKLALSYLLRQKLSLGLSVGMYHSSLPTSIDVRSQEVHSSSASGLGGLDLAVQYRLRDDIDLGLILRNFGYGAGLTWEMSQTSSAFSDYSLSVEEHFLPVIALGGRYEGQAAGKPLIVTCDLNGYLFDGELSLKRIFDGDVELLAHPQMVINGGAQWQGWEALCVRAGLRDITLNGELLRDRDGYLFRHTPSVTAGIGLDLSEKVTGLRMNYALATARLGAVPDQMLDFVLSF